MAYQVALTIQLNWLDNELATAVQHIFTDAIVFAFRSNDTKLICAVGSRNGTEETKLMVLDFDVEGACTKCT